MYRLIALLLCLSSPAMAETALAAVAANFAGTASALAESFHNETGHEITITTGSSGKLYAQITQGAPFDLLLSADAATPARLASEGHGIAVPYAIGKLVLWAPHGGSDPVELLQSAPIHHIAIANPALAPYGAAAKEAMQNMGLWDDLQPKIVMGQNVGQTFSLVKSGAAEVGFIAASSLSSDATGLIYPVPQSLFTPIRQDAILLDHGANNPAAIGFLAYLQSKAAQTLIKDHGYEVPQ